MRPRLFLILNIFVCWCHQVVYSLSPEDTDGLIRLAREYKRGGVREKSEAKTPPDLEKASQLYKRIIDEGEGPSHVEALFELASINTQSPSDNFILLSKASELGHAMAQHQMSAALFTGVGVGGLVPRDPGRALILEQFSALSGTPEAHLGMGYRYMMGEGVPKSCENAIQYFEFAANEAAWQREERGHGLYVERSHLAQDVEEGLAAGGGVSQGEITTDMVNYYEHLAAEHDQHAVQSLVQIYSHGSRAVPVDMAKAMKYLHIAATEFKLTAAAGQLGYLLATRPKRSVAADLNEGIGHAADHSQIAELLQLSYDNHDSWGVLGMGYCFYKGGCGGGIQRNISRALESFQRVHSKHPEAAYYIGELLMGMGGLYEVEQLVAEGVSRDEADGTVASSPALAEIQVDVASAFQFYSSASARGHLLATHRLAQIQLWGGSVIEERADQASIAADRAKGIMSSSFAQRKANRRGRGGAVVPRSCESAAAAFKNVAERGDWALQLNTAHSLYSAGDRCGALRVFSQLAAMGYETAQANAAFILSQSSPACPAWLPSEVVDAIVQTAQSESANNKGADGGSDGAGATESVSGGDVSSVAIIGAKQWADARNYSEFAPRHGSGGISAGRGKQEGVQKLQLEEEGNVQGTDLDRTFAISDLFEARALSLYRQSALLGNAGSFRKMGDLHYYGSGGLASDKHEAALLYQLAADYGQTHAMFNLGVMHEMGDGVEQDFHLAKRYYDQTAEYDPSARVPSLLAVYFLRAHKEFQQRVGKETTDQVGAAIMQVLAPFLKIADWRDTITGLLFPERNVTVSSGSGDYQYVSDKDEMSPVSLLLWKCWDKFHSVGAHVTSTAQNAVEYLFRFSSRFVKSPLQALSSLTSKALELIGSDSGEALDRREGSDGRDEGTASATASSATDTTRVSGASSEPLAGREASGFLSMDAEAEADFELILLLTLLVIFLVLVDHRRQRLRAERRRVRERRRRRWDTITVFEIRDLIQEEEGKKDK